jgi:hypothetical protein
MLQAHFGSTGYSRGQPCCPSTSIERCGSAASQERDTLACSSGELSTIGQAIPGAPDRCRRRAPWELRGAENQRPARDSLSSLDTISDLYFNERTTGSGLDPPAPSGSAGVWFVWGAIATSLGQPDEAASRLYVPGPRFGGSRKQSLVRDICSPAEVVHGRRAPPFAPSSCQPKAAVEPLDGSAAVSRTVAAGEQVSGAVVYDAEA